MSEPVGPPRPSDAATQAPGPSLRLLMRREWGLIVLALALTLMVFSLVRDDISRPQELAHLVVEADTRGADDIVVLFPRGREEITLQINGSDSDFVEAERATRGAEGRPVRLVVGDVTGASRRVGPRDRLVVPFPESYLGESALDKALASLEGYVYRVKPREMAVAVPTTQPGPANLATMSGVRCEVLFDGPTTVSLPMPDGMAPGPLVPDPIDLRPLLAERPADGTIMALATPLTFTQWARQGSVEGEALYRSELEMPVLKVHVKFTTSEQAWDSTPMANVVVLLVKDPSLYEFRVPANDRIFMNDLMDRVEGILRAPRAVHEGLRKSAEENLAGDALRGWCWGIEIVQGELPRRGDGDRPAGQELRGALRFVPLDPRYFDPAIEFIPRELQSIDFEISVTLRE